MSWTELKTTDQSSANGICAATMISQGNQTRPRQNANKAIPKTKTPDRIATPVAANGRKNVKPAPARMPHNTTNTNSLVDGKRVSPSPRKGFENIDAGAS